MKIFYTSGSRGAEWGKGACAESAKGSGILARGIGHRFSLRTCALIGVGFVSLASGTSYAVVNVYPSTPSLQTDFINNATTYFQGTLTPSPYFPGTFSFALTGKKPSLPPANCPPPSTIDTQLAIATTTLADLSTNYFLTGWMLGKDDERWTDIGMVNSYTACSTSTFKAPHGISTSTWKVPSIDTTTCSFILGYLANSIYQQSFSSPTYSIPGY